jgi:hypothetical protein
MRAFLKESKTSILKSMISFDMDASSKIFLSTKSQEQKASDHVLKNASTLFKLETHLSFGDSTIHTD